MTREEIIACYSEAAYGAGLAAAAGNENFMRDYELFKSGLDALRGPTREQVEKAWNGCSWCNNEGKRPENWECSLLDDRGYSVVVGDEVVWTNAEFCPVCGAPLTDEAVDLLTKRLEEVLNEKENT